MHIVGVLLWPLGVAVAAFLRMVAVRSTVVAPAPAAGRCTSQVQAMISGRTSKIDYLCRSHLNRQRYIVG